MAGTGPVEVFTVGTGYGGFGDDIEAERQRGGHRAVEVFTVGTGYGGFGDDIEELLGLVAAGRLDPQIGWRGAWDRAAEAVEALRSRKVAGKAVVEIGAE